MLSLGLALVTQWQEWLLDAVWNQLCSRQAVAGGWPPELAVVKKPFSISWFPAISSRVATEEGGPGRPEAQPDLGAGKWFLSSAIHG